MDPVEPAVLQDWLAWALVKCGEYPMVPTLVVLMLIDIVTGMMAASATGTLSSKVSATGAIKKSIVIILVGVAAVLERLQSDLPLTKLTALFFIVTEGLSILENARRCGVPVPKFLGDALGSIRGVRDGAVETTRTVTETTPEGATKTSTTHTHKSEPPDHVPTAPDHSSSWLRKNGKPVPSSEAIKEHGQAVAERQGLKREQEKPAEGGV